MKIQVLGSGCPTCKNLFEITKKIANELGIDAEVEYVNDVSKMIEMGVMQSPVLAIDGKPVLMGGGHNEEDIKKTLTDKCLNKESNDCLSKCCNC